MKRQVVGMALFAMSVSVLASCAGVLPQALAKEIDRSSFPAWISSFAIFCLFAAVSLGLVSLVGILADRRNRWMGLAIGANLVTLGLIAWLIPVA